MQQNYLEILYKIFYCNQPCISSLHGSINIKYIVKPWQKIRWQKVGTRKVFPLFLCAGKSKKLVHAYLQI